LLSVRRIRNPHHIARMLRASRRRSETMKRLMTVLALGLFSVAFLGGCNTVAGAGKDVQKAGEKVEDAAKK